MGSYIPPFNSLINRMNFLSIRLLFLSAALIMGITTPVISHAEVAAKIKNATETEVRQALQDTLKATEEALNALKSGAAPEVVQEHIGNARQLVKRVEINRLDVIRTRSSEKLKNARQALNKGEKDKAEEFLTTALQGFQEMARLF